MKTKTQKYSVKIREKCIDILLVCGMLFAIVPVQAVVDAETDATNTQLVEIYTDVIDKEAHADSVVEIIEETVADDETAMEFNTVADEVAFV